MGRGYFGIGIEHGKTVVNLGTLWRSAHIFGADFIFTINGRYRRQPSDTMATWRHVPLFQYASFEALVESLPKDSRLIGIEQCTDARALGRFQHPDRAIYVLGAEDHGLSASALTHCHDYVEIETGYCLNVAVAGSIVMWHRQQQRVKANAV